MKICEEKIKDFISELESKRKRLLENYKEELAVTKNLQEVFELLETQPNLKSDYAVSLEKKYRVVLLIG